MLKYRSRTGVHNCLKEYRDTGIAGAINQMYNEMAGNYKVNNHQIKIIKAMEL